MTEQLIEDKEVYAAKLILEAAKNDSKRLKTTKVPFGMSRDTRFRVLNNLDETGLINKKNQSAYIELGDEALSDIDDVVRNEIGGNMSKNAIDYMEMLIEWTDWERFNEYHDMAVYQSPERQVKSLLRNIKDVYRA